MKPPGLEEARRRRKPGRCLFCLQPAPKTRSTCGRDDCLRAYNRAWHRDAQRAHPERYGAKFYRDRRARPSAATRQRKRAAKTSPFTPTTCFLPGMPYSELCRLFAERYGS